MRLRSLAIALAATTIAPLAWAQQDGAHPGKAVYDAACATCHNDPANTPGAERAATLSVLRETGADTLRASLTGDGKMAPMAAALSEQQLTQLIGWLTAEQKAADVPWDEAMLCAADNRVVDVNVIDVEETESGPRPFRLRERIRADGPTIDYTSAPAARVSHAA